MMCIIEYNFFQNALIGGLLASIVCGIVGTYIVTRRLVFISGGITHASFGGIGLGVYFGINPILSAMLFAVASACGVCYVTEHCGVREDSSIAIFWTLGMSIGIIFSFLSPNFMPELPSYLFGNILTIGKTDILMLLVVAVIIATLFILMGPSIVSIAFDPVFAKSQGMPVRAIEYAMMTIIAITIVSVLRMVGVVLAISLLTIPQITANLFCNSFRQMMFLSIAFSIIYTFVGIALSYWLAIPSGATIILVSVVVYGSLKTIKAAKVTFYRK